MVPGKVNGSIEASELVRIGETGSVEGAISAPRLVVAVGARLQGRIDVWGLGWEPHSPPARPRPISGLRCSCVSELPSVALTQRFLALCEHHGSQHLAVKLVAVGRGTGVQGLPESDDWTTWDAGQMRAAVEYLEHLRVR